MKTFKLVIKGILLYLTLIYWMLAISLADSFNAILLLIVLAIGFALIFLCKAFITVEDLAKLTYNNPKEIKNETI